MNETIPAPETLLDFKGSPIRVVTFEDGGPPWFSLLDVCEALGWDPEYIRSRCDRRDFLPHGKRVAEEVREDGVQEVTVLSSVGLWHLTAIEDPGKGQSIAAWAKREAVRLCPTARKDDPAVYLTLNPDGSLPPRPLKYSGRRSEWYDLKESPAYVSPQDAFQAAVWAREKERMDQLVAYRAAEAAKAGNSGEAAA